MGKEFEYGVVRDLDLGAQTYSVSIADEVLQGVRCALGPFASMFGIKSTFRVPVGTHVCVWMGPRPHIVACLPADLPDSASHAGRSITGSGIKDLANQLGRSGEIPGHNAAQDLFDGEFEMGFNQAGFIRFMTMMTAVGGCERAQIQFHLLRDLVRMISGNFEHFSAYGDDVIMDDGKVSIEFNGTHHPHERMGLLKEGDPLEQEADSFDGEEFDPLRTGRWRYTRMLGHIGGMMNEWFTDPAETVGKMAEDAIRSGLSREWRGPEGEILFQTTSEFAVERVTRIPVPIRLKHHDDPEGVLRREFKELDNTYLKTWPQKGGQTGHHSLFMLRDYSRWLSQYHSLARIHQLAAKAGEFSVPSEADTPAPKVGKHDADVNKANEGNIYWKEVYATIRIGRDGSILFRDGFHNTYHSGPHGIMIDSSRHLRFSAAGDISAIAGGSMFLRARRHMELVSSLGSLLVKARTSLRGLVEKGSLFLSSEADPANPYTPAEGDPAAELDENGYGVVLAAPMSGVHVDAGKGVRIDQRSADHNLTVENKGKTRLNLVKELDAILRGGGLVDTVGSYLGLSGRGVICRSAEGFLVPNGASIGPNRVQVSSLFARSVISLNGFVGPSDRVAKSDDISSPDTSLPEGAENPPRVPDTKPSTIKWGGLDAAEYNHPGSGPEGSPGGATSMFESLTQQHLRLESPGGYSPWVFESLESGLRVDTSRTFTFPGKSPKWLIHQAPSEPDLSEASATLPSAMGPLANGVLTEAAIQFKHLDR